MQEGLRPRRFADRSVGLKPHPQGLESGKAFPESRKAIRQGQISLPESKIAFPQHLFRIREGKKAISMQQIAAPEWLFCIPLMKF